MLALALILALNAFAEVRTYDVSGAPGAKDPDATPSFDAGPTRGRGRAGEAGGDAREAFTGRRLDKKGWDAGELKLNLSVEADTTIRVDGRAVGPEHTYRNVVIDRLPLKSSTSFLLKARGGAGGAGGRGGRGQDGGRGHDGLDATRFSSGSNGDDGARGGDEGASTDGGDAGAGGAITVEVPIADTDLAMLLDEVDVRGNSGGARGVSRGVGRGGAGGAGGSSYWWTETHYRPATRVTFDGDGNASTETYMESYLVMHSNPGGWDGARGSDGRPSAKQTRRGADSSAGRFTFAVRDESGAVTKYESPYDLRLLPGYALAGSHNTNGFFEPGETITLSGLRVVNSGQSPTPLHQPITVFMSDNAEYVRSNGEELTIPKVLEPGEIYEFTGRTISFHLTEKRRDVAGRLRDVDVVAPRARVARVEREFNNFPASAPTTIKVQLPIEITPLQTLITIAPGEATRAYFHVKNISTQTFGPTSQNPWLRRAAVQFLRTAGSTKSEDFVISFQPDRDATSPEAGLMRQLVGLKPGESVIVETFAGFKKNAAPYSKVGIQPELFLQSILNPRQINRVQFEPFDLRVSRAFRYSPDADVLLVANHGLDAKVLDAFEATAALKQLKMDVWDFSRHGFFNFSHHVDDYGPLFEAYRGKTIVVLGNVARTPLGETRAQNFLGPDEVVAAARRFGIKIVVLDTSDDPAATVARLTEPTPLKKAADKPDADVREFVSNRHYVREFSKAVHEVQEALGDVTSFLGISRVQVTQTPLWPWSAPKETRVRRQAHRALRATERLAPESRVFIDYDFNPRLIGTRFWLWKRWNLGSIRIRRSVDESKTSVVAIKLPPHRLEDPDFIMGEEFQTAFDFALNFNTKLDVFNSIILGRYHPKDGEVHLPERFRHLRARAPMDYARVLTHTLLLDLLHEQITVRPLGVATKVRERDLWDKLDLLKKWTHHDYTQFKLDPAAEEGRMFVDLVASLRFFNFAITTVWQRWFSANLSQNLRVSLVTKQMLDRLVNAVFADVPAARAAIDVRLGELREHAMREGLARENLVAFLDRKGLGEKVVRDGQVHRAPADRVRDAARGRELRSAEARRHRAARATRRAVASEIKRLKLSPADCERLLADDVAPWPRAVAR